MIALVATAALAQSEPDADVPALVDTASGCTAVTAIESIPVANAVDVPVDVHPSLVFDGECGAMAFELRVSNPATAEVLASMAWTLPAEVPAIATLVPEAPLPANTDLVLSATSTDGWGELVQVPFRTGDAAAGGLSGTLTIAVVDATYAEGDDTGTMTATVAVTPVVDPTGLSLVRVTGQNGPVWFRPEDLASPVTLGWPVSSPPEQVCFQAVQFDGLGIGIGPASDCVPFEAPGPDGGCGCDGTAAGGGFGLAALALLVARRRR